MTNLAGNKVDSKESIVESPLKSLQSKFTFSIELISFEKNETISDTVSNLVEQMHFIYEKDLNSSMSNEMKISQVFNIPVVKYDKDLSKIPELSNKNTKED